jgi:hypothetical protein
MFVCVKNRAVAADYRFALKIKTRALQLNFFKSVYFTVVPFLIEAELGKCKHHFSYPWPVIH